MSEDYIFKLQIKTEDKDWKTIAEIKGSNQQANSFRKVVKESKIKTRVIQESI